MAFESRVRVNFVETKSGENVLDMNNPNEGFLQVLEEVCQKQGYNADDYDIK